MYCSEGMDVAEVVWRRSRLLEGCGFSQSVATNVMSYG